VAAERANSPSQSASANDGATVQPSSAFRYAKFRIWWAGSFAAMAGVRLNQVALTVLVFDITGSALDLGVLAASTALPTIFVSIFGGVLADRLNTRLVLAFSTSIIATVLSVIAVLVITEAIEIWHIFALAALNGVALGLDEPSRETYFTSLIPKEALRSAVTNNGALRASNSVLMPTLGGVIISIAGLSAAFFIAAGGWAVMLVTLLFLPSRKVVSASRNPIRDLTEGFRYIAQRRVFKAIIALSFVNIFFGAGWIQILPAYVDRFDGDATQVGFLFSAAGLGALTGIIISGKLNSSKYVGRVILGACLLFSTSLLAMALSPGMAISIPAAYVAHLGNGLFMMSSRTAIQIRVEEHVRGRVMGIVMITNSLFVLSGLFTGTMAAAFGVKTGMLVGPFIIISAALIMMATQPLLRNLDGRPDNTD
jgi:MFS family permease